MRMKTIGMIGGMIRPSTADWLTYMSLRNPSFRHKTIKIIIRLADDQATFNIQDKILARALLDFKCVRPIQPLSSQHRTCSRESHSSVVQEHRDSVFKGRENGE